MSLFNLPIVQKEKPASIHPWSNTVKDQYSSKIKHAHNSVRNVIYPKPKQKVCSKNRIKFTVIGNRVTKEFIYCVHLVRGMHKYRWKNFDSPDIRGVSGVEWLQVLNDIKNRFGGLAYCLTSQVVVLYNGNLLGGEEELKNLIEMRYSYHLVLDYQKESILQFTNFIKSTGRTCAYLHISIDDKPIGSLVFMLYSDIVPVTCENFLRLCTAKRGGYGGTPIHRIVKDGWIQCGGFGIKNVPITCENFIIPHDRRGVLGMANAGRHLDCSTQFFVLLQPADWLQNRFVAFGQLIDGEETLQTIEKVETFYESPISNVIIYKTGILNLDCHGIMINKNANAYIDAHIDDLVAIADLFYEMLMEHVFLEVEFRRIQRLEVAGEGEELPEIVDEGEKKDIRATKRFIRKKEEIQAHVDNYARSTGSKHSEKDDKENNDFDVDSYEPEEYSYKQVTPPGEKAVVKNRPYYIPLTDVPYPGEIDSNYDLKRLLQGDYCLESDLDKKGVLPKKDKKANENKLTALSDVLSSYKQVGSDESEEEEEEEEEKEFDEDEEREIKKYLKLYAEQVSFSGMTIRRIAKKYVNDNPLSGKTNIDAFTDEEVRRLKLATADLKSRQGKKISISVEPWETHTQIKRRQTGFVRPQDLAKILSHQTDLEEEEEDEIEEEQDKPLWKYHERKVSISVPKEDLPAHKIKRRQTGFVRPDDVVKLRAYKKSISGIADDDDEDDDLAVKKDDDEDVEEETKLKVRITAPAGDHDQHSLRRPTAFARPTNIDDDDEDDDDADANKTRPSVLVRLYDDVALDDDEPVPTLKDYRPLAEMKVGKKNLMLTMSSGLRDNELHRKENYFRQSMTGDDDSYEQIMALQHGKKIARKISSDYVKTIDQIERKPETSIRSVEFAKTRPSLTVSQYQMKNQLHAIEMKHKEEKEKDKKKIEHKKDQGKAAHKTAVKDSRGLRLPGDTPLYGSRMSLKSDHR